MAAWEQRRNYLQRELFRIERVHFLILGCMRSLLAAKAMGLVNDPPLPFNSLAQRFEQRFSCFTSVVRPEPVSFNDYVASTDTSNIDALTLLKMATDSLGSVSVRASLFLHASVIHC